MSKHLRLFEEETSPLSEEQKTWLDQCIEQTKKKYYAYNTPVWTYDAETGLVNVEGHFSCQGQGLSDFKGIRFGKITKTFDCSKNNLTTLEGGGPEEVGWSYDCSQNKLTSLKGSPKKMIEGSRFICRENLLTNLDGIPEFDESCEFDCSTNQLRSLDGSPKSLRDFICSENYLKDLMGGPEVVTGIYGCHAQKEGGLISLKGSPEEVGSLFLCSVNSLKTLENGPRIVGGGYNCSYNKLEKLTPGFPEKVGKSYDGKSFSCKYNRLKTLDGLPLMQGELQWEPQSSEKKYKLTLQISFELGIHIGDPDKFLERFFPS